MTTFDLPEVRAFAADLESRRSKCDNGEGMLCATLDDTLRQYAALCCEFRERVRQWGRAVFAGRAAFDPEVERVWLDEGFRLYNKAVEMLGYGHEAQGPCYTLEGQGVLRAALWELGRLLGGWVTPRLAVGPSARQGLALSPRSAEEARRLIASMPPLPAHWQPTDPRQRMQFSKIQSPRTS